MKPVFRLRFFITIGWYLVTFLRASPYLLYTARELPPGDYAVSSYPYTDTADSDSRPTSVFDHKLVSLEVVHHDGISDFSRGELFCFLSVRADLFSHNIFIIAH